MSSGPCQKPALANAWRRARPANRGSASRNHAHSDDAPFGFVRPGEHQLRSVHRLFVEHAHFGDFVVLADVRLGARTLFSVTRIAAVVRDVHRDFVGNRDAERAPRAGFRRAGELDDRQRCRTTATRASRTTLISGQRLLRMREASCRQGHRGPARRPEDERRASATIRTPRCRRRTARRPRAE